mgnify:CR=1 FL=1
MARFADAQQRFHLAEVDDPVLQAQVRLPGVFVQVAFMPQPPFDVRHSLRSVHWSPLPVKPGLHMQLGPDAVLVHAAFALQPPLLVRHSLTSLHTSPLPE